MTLGPASDQATAALEAAAIAPERRGADRTRRLSEPERALYRWILDRFARAEPPPALDRRGRELGLDPAGALARLAPQGLVHADERGAVVAYPFSARPRGHRERSEIAGVPISIPEAIADGRAVFGSVVEEV